MDQEKIGKFIAVCRKENGYTQASLAEQLGITDRAVSKWENGRSMPDVSIMPELCHLLKINVNELLTGEHITMDTYKEAAEKNLIELRELEAASNRKLLQLENVLLLVTLVPFLTMMGTACFLADRGYVLLSGILIAVGLASLLVAGIFGIKIEHDAGYYECPNCGERYVPTMKAVVMAPHFGTTRRMKCPRCGQKGYHKKVLTKEE